tara:strand:+ start:267 stop:623 length:357 start_codon:yes stop_codon:yes gene_type:complete
MLKLILNFILISFVNAVFVKEHQKFIPQCDCSCCAVGRTGVIFNIFKLQTPKIVTKTIEKFENYSNFYVRWRLWVAQHFAPGNVILGSTPTWCQSIVTPRRRTQNSMFDFFYIVDEFE